jgi:hypothetical protein
MRGGETMKAAGRFKAEIVALIWVALLWAANVKTNCVPRAPAGVFRQVVKVAPNSRYAYQHAQRQNDWLHRILAQFADATRVLAKRVSVFRSPGLTSRVVLFAAVGAQI